MILPSSGGVCHSPNQEYFGIPKYAPKYPYSCKCNKKKKSPWPSQLGNVFLICVFLCTRINILTPT